MTYTPNLDQLKSATTLQDVAFLLDKTKPANLSYHLYILGTDRDKSTKEKYTEFEIPKKQGGTRKILAPNKELKKIQSSLSNFLYDCIEEINLTRKIKGNLSYGYQRGISTMNHAKVHSKKRFVFNIDLKDFFDSINFGRVRGFFIANNNFSLHPKVATILAQIACHNNSLPQGSPCSPVISNLIGHIVDIKLAQLATSCGCSYSRYCDDITFSTNKKVFPHKIAFSNDSNEYLPSKNLINIIERSGFEINLKKVRMSLFYSQQNVTGLTVNKRVNTPRLYRDTVRALVHHLCFKGDFEFKKPFIKDKVARKKDELDERAIRERKLNSLQGMLNYIARIESDYRDNNLCSKSKQPSEICFKNNLPNTNKLTKNEKVLRDYLLYRYFFGTDRVMIFGEGKTDKSHLQHYLNFRSEENLPVPSSFDEWKGIQFGNFENKLFNVISGSGGTGDINKLIESYGGWCKDFHKDISQKPLIILVDNDVGSKKINQTIQDMKKPQKAIGEEDFYHIYHNMYVIYLPKINNGETDIESFYSEDILDVEVDGRFFEKSKKISDKGKYSKSLFASRTVPQNHTLTDWSKFDQIFERVQLAIEDFQSR